MYIYIIMYVIIISLSISIRGEASTEVYLQHCCVKILFLTLQIEFSFLSSFWKGHLDRLPQPPVYSFLFLPIIGHFFTVIYAHYVYITLYSIHPFFLERPFSLSLFGINLTTLLSFIGLLCPPNTSFLVSFCFSKTSSSSIKFRSFLSFFFRMFSNYFNISLVSTFFPNMTRLWPSSFL